MRPPRQSPHPPCASRRCGWVLALSFVLAALAGCSSRPATPAQCGAIFDAIVARELQERGFRDPALARRKRAELRAQLGPELARCVGHPLRPNALVCIKRAKDVEEISHRCLH